MQFACHSVVWTRKFKMSSEFFQCFREWNVQTALQTDMTQIPAKKTCRFQYNIKVYFIYYISMFNDDSQKPTLKNLFKDCPLTMGLSFGG